MSRAQESPSAHQAEHGQEYSRETDRGAVVVGYDGSEHAQRALDWAVEEARLRNATLAPAAMVVPLVSYGIPELPDDMGLEAAAHLLAGASQRVRERAPDLRVRPIRMVTTPAHGLMQLAEDAQLMVLGSRGRGGVASMILGSVSLRVAQRAACPTVVVPPGATTGEHHRIVVGIDGSAQSQAALSFAVSEAALRGAGVLAVHSVADAYLGSGFFPPASELVRAREEAGTRFLHDDLGPWRAKHPEIDITAALTHEPAETALAAHAADADMLVVGARGRNAVTGLFLGSVSHAALHAATVPVVLLHAEPSMTP